MVKHSNTFMSLLASAALVAALCPVAPAAAAASVQTAEPYNVPEVPVAEIPEDPNTYRADELVVVLDDYDGTSNGDQTLRDKTVDEIESDDVAVAESCEQVLEASEQNASVMEVGVAQGVDLEAAQQELADMPGVAYVQPNYKYHALDETAVGDLAVPTATPNDPDLGKQYYLDSVHTREAWAVEQSNGAATVAVLDTGCTTTHSDLSSNILHAYKWDALNQTNAGVITYENGSEDYSAHGTHVAGIISGVANNGAGIAGVSHNACILPIKVLDRNGDGDTTGLIRAYKYMFDLVDTGKVKNLHVVNMSLGSYETDVTDLLFCQSITKAKNDYGIVTVCAGGNGTGGKPNTRYLFPADYKDCVSVTSLERDGTNTYWSDFNWYKDISAPGESIYATYNGVGGKWYASLSGTSMAAPIVSGVFALLWSANNNLTVAQACESVYATAVTVNDTTYDRRFVSGSKGRIDAKAALSYAISKYGRSQPVYNPQAAYKTVAAPAASKQKETAAEVTKATAKIPSYVKNFKKAKVKSFKVKAVKKHKVKATYKKVAKATGYKIAYKKAGTKGWTYKRVKKTSWTSGKLKKKTKYNVSVRPYLVYKGKTYYGKWASTKLVKTTK